MIEFGTQDKPCYFCGHPQTIGFHEHFIFCPDCSAIYTFMLILEAVCDHVEKAPVIYRHPWFDRDTNKPFIYAATLDDQYPYRCSECDALVLADGW
jgi:hypothetical protein